MTTPSLLQSGLSELPFFYIKSYALLIDPLRDWEMYLARWVKFTVEKQRLSKLYYKICLNKNTSHDATNVLWRIFYQSTQNLNNFLTSKEMTKTGLLFKGGDPIAIYIGYIVFALWDMFIDAWMYVYVAYVNCNGDNMAMGFEKQR